MATTNFYYPLLTSTQLKSLISTVNNNISDTYIESIIEIEQKKVIRPLLGYSLYNQIQEQLSGLTGSGDSFDISGYEWISETFSITVGENELGFGDDISRGSVRGSYSVGLESRTLGSWNDSKTIGGEQPLSVLKSPHSDANSLSFGVVESTIFSGIPIDTVVAKLIHNGIETKLTKRTEYSARSVPGYWQSQSIFVEGEPNLFTPEMVGTTIDLEIQILVPIESTTGTTTGTTTDTGVTIGLSPENEIIYDDYLKMILAYSVYKRLIVDMSYQLENSGLRKKYSDVSELAEQSELTYVRKMVQEDLDFYKIEMVKYIQQNVSKYPLYFNDTDSRWNSKDNERVRGYNFGWNIRKI